MEPHMEKEESRGTSLESDVEDGGAATPSIDEEKDVGVGPYATEQIATSARDRPPARAKSLRSLKSCQSRAGGDGYTCFDAEHDEPPNRPTGEGNAASQEPFLVTWEGGDADPLNPRSMTKLKRWAVVCIVSGSSLCV